MDTKRSLRHLEQILLFPDTPHIRKLLQTFPVLIPLVFLICLTVFFRFERMQKELSKPGNFSLTVLNGEAAHNLLDGHGLTLDETRMMGNSEMEQQQGHIIDPQDVEVAPNADPLYTPLEDETGYPLFLALLWKLTGSERYIYASLFQIGVAALMVTSIFFFCQKYFSRPTGFLAGFLYAVYPPEVQTSVLPHQYAWIGPIYLGTFLLIMAITAHSSQRKNMVLSLLLGLVMSIGASMRSTLLLLPFIAAISFFALLPWRKALLTTAITTASFTLIMGSLLVWNPTGADELRPTRKVFWHTVAVGLGQFPNPWGFLPIDGSVRDSVQQGQSHLSLTEYEKTLKNELLTFIKKNPLLYGSLIIERIPMALFPSHWALIQGKVLSQEIDGKEVYYRQPYDGKQLFFFFVMSAFSLLALIGAWMARSQWRKLLPLYLLWGYCVAVYSLLYVQPLYLYPLTFIYAIFSAVAVEKIFLRLWKFFASYERS